MTITTPPKAESISAAIHELAASPGPCISLVLPPFHPGDATSSSALVKSNIQAVARRLVELGLPDAGPELLQPIEARFDRGSHWCRAIFRSPSLLQEFILTQSVTPSVSVGNYFSIRPLLAELALPPVFYILALSKNRVSLLRCRGVRAEPTSLPQGVPELLADSLALEPPDHRLENRSAAGHSTGAMQGVSFGTGSGREREKTHLADFYKIVDRGLKVSGIPIILAGADEETTIFRQVSTKSNLIRESIRGSLHPDRDETELLRRAYSILHSERRNNQVAALLEARERNAPARFSTSCEAIVRAAFEGRISQLYLSESAERPGMFQDDPLNVAAIQTILHHGEAFAIPAANMLANAIAAAVMRY